MRLGTYLEDGKLDSDYGSPQIKIQSVQTGYMQLHKLMSDEFGNVSQRWEARF